MLESARQVRPYRNVLSIVLERSLNSCYFGCWRKLFEEALMTIKFPEDLVPLTKLKVNPSRVVQHTTEVHRPVLLTSRGRGVAVVQSVGDYEKMEEEREFMRAVVTGLSDLEESREVSLDDARTRLGLK